MSIIKNSLRLVSLCILLTLGGCSSFFKAEQPIGLGDTKRWQVHQQKASQIEDWQISGKISVRNSTQSGSGTLAWQQQQEHFDIQVNGPLGQGSIRLSGLPGRVELTTNQLQIRAGSAEQLMQQQLGWSIPLESLLWWVRGLPAPNMQHQLELNDNSQAYRIHQAGWQLDYLSYQDTPAGVPLPQRIRARSPELLITLYIRQWQD